jgi:hypothetical protein
MLVNLACLFDDVVSSSILYHLHGREDSRDERNEKVAD